MKCDKSLFRLYGVSAGDRTSSEDLLQAIQGGITLFQLREKDLDFDSFLRKAREFRKICSDHGIPFIVNDAVEIARECDADGVHIGQEDESLSNARKILGPEKIIGVSVHTLEEACRAERGGADYLGVGALFSTSTKLDAVSFPLSDLGAICAGVKIPVVGIGGINQKNIMQLAHAGLSGAAIVSAIFCASDIAESARELDSLSRQIFRMS
ncbi:MAG: thiamine phosphate synthase [Planctomycetia bacterium]|nr:thiamine phosphate synthase [Planctomycetia bacterium]